MGFGAWRDGKDRLATVVMSILAALVMSLVGAIAAGLWLKASPLLAEHSMCALLSGW